jgi:P4 family phage/plasmid primase-like protien
MTDIKNIKAGNEFRAFLEQHRVVKKAGVPHIISHTSLANPQGCFYIPPEKKNDFFRLYRKAIKANTPIHLNELHKEQGPIVIDLDFKYTRPKERSDRIYNEALVKLVISKYNYYISQFLEVEEDDCAAYVFEKPKPSMVCEMDDMVTMKDGFHIMYPRICTRPNLQYVMRLCVMNDIAQNNLFDHIHTDNNLDDIFDKAVILRNGWMMYGSSKPEGQRYELTHVYDTELNEVELDEDEVYELVEDLSIRKFKPDDVTAFHQNMNEPKVEALYEKLNPRATRKGGSTGKPEEIRLAQMLVNLLSSKRGDSYEPWIHLGFCLHNIDDTLLDTWIDFSRKSIKFKEGECEKAWNGFKDTGYSVKSLHYWARHDSPGAYADLMLAELDAEMISALSATSYDVAKAFFELHKYDYTYSMKTWFYFNGNNWEVEPDTSRIVMQLNENMANIFSKMSNIFGDKAIAVNGGEKDKMLERQKQCIQLSLRIRQSSFKKNIIEELTALFNKKKFFEMLDERRELICFNNGVYDLKNLMFRPGAPDDCISMSTNIDFIPYDPKNPIVAKVEHFLTEVLPEQDIRDYVLTILATCLAGHANDEKIYIWTGSGGNGKSLCIQLTQFALGDYAAIMPITLITSKRAASNAATPELAKIKGRRLAIFQEPDNNMEINAGLMKELTGNDKIQARALFKDPIEFFPQFKPILTCNRLPVVPSTDGGTWRRIRIVPFEMKFVDNPVEDYEKKIDRTIKENLVNWKEAFMAILIKYYKQFKEKGIFEPPKVMEFTKQYERDCDTFKEFIDNAIAPEEGAILSVQDLYRDFTRWYKHNNSGGKTTPNKNELKYEIEEKIRKKFDIQGNLKGFKIAMHVNSDGKFFDQEANILDM